MEVRVGDFRPSRKWRARESLAWKRLILGSYAMLGLTFLPMLFGDNLTPTFAVIWYVPIGVAYLALGAWLVRHILRQFRTARGELAAWRRGRSGGDASSW